MPFLIPAIGAGVCDAVIVHLCYHAGDLRAEAAYEGRLVYKSVYVMPLAIVRLVLLIAPLPYRSYTGTAVKCPLLYQAFYVGTIGLVLLHMLSLGMVDPGSLSTLLPATDDSEDYSAFKKMHIALMRHLWFVLGLSVLASICHAILFLHVRSTAPANADIRQRRGKVMFYYVREQGEDSELNSLLHGTTTAANGVASAAPTTTTNGVLANHEETIPLRRQNSNNSLNSRLQMITTEFVHEMQARIKKTKKEWTKFLNDYRSSTHPGSPASSNGQDVMPRQLSPFRVLLQLFAYEDVLQNGHLEIVYMMDDGASLMFYIPQLLSFLLHGAYESSEDLESWVLETCKRNVFFAHRCYWFLRAWCLEIKESADKQRISRSNSLSSMAGAAAPSASGVIVAGGSGGGGGALGDSATLDDHSIASYDVNRTEPKFLPQERAVLEGLLIRVMECGEKSARMKHFGGAGQDNDSSVGNEVISPSALMLATESGSIPVDPQTGMPSARHWDSYAAQRKFGFLPLDKALTNNVKPDLGDTFFDATPLFMDSLLEIADTLFRIQKEKRGDELVRLLQALECRALPSNSIYMPIRDSRHRVWRIVADESIAISTKERVPCIICLEVICYGNRQKKSGPGGANSSKDVRKLFDRASRGGSESSSPSLEEFQLLQEWRFGYRDPHRRDAPLEKLAYTMRDGIRKIPISQMRTSVNDTMSKIRETTNNNLREILTLNVPESLDETMEDGLDTTLPPTTTLNSMPSTDIERGSLNEEVATERHATNGHGSAKHKNGPASSSSTITFTPRSTRDLEGQHNNDDIHSNKNNNSSSNNYLSNDGRPPSAQARPRTSTAESEVSTGTAPSSSTTTTVPPASPRSPRSNKQNNPVMGQWASPSIHDRPPPQSQKFLLDESLVLPPIRSQASSSTSTENGARNRLPRGSDHQVYGANGVTSRRIHNLQSNGRSSSSNGGLDGGNSNSNGNGHAHGHGHGVESSRSKPGERILQNARKTTKIRPPPVVFKEDWHEKEERVRSRSVMGSHPGWKLLPILIKSNDDLRQEQLASQLIFRISTILARERVPVWLCPYEILAITDRGGIIEAIPDTISIASLKKNDPNYTTLRDFFHTFFDHSDDLAAAKANFCESLAAYSIVCFLLQIKDRHNGNILLDNLGHLIHIDFGFFFLSSPGKNTGFESAPFKLSREMVEVLGGPDSRLFRTFRILCYRCFIALRRNCLEIILLVEMLKKGNEDLACFRGRPDDAIKGLRERFRLDLNDRACMEYVNALVDESLENWRTDWYDRYQRYCVGVL
mmetsp:Transcript_20567/g.58459  ORF Transcript_20567/g.58459 Transcript_20567/m.58459 type:complete len:1294 (+) Transcript_20567:63-3944(+)|eukprot:CAMPEP_0119560772 /NCGR_PEP_ID=MMETSP1352-20130426/15815_1 /TAXON_ID=265584 /ORGANISM="Stauroneis constricta, Strain CCMP1120" /LENGTH=1293 /DNA_ID=CAMNT_0007608823 /DNA_START=119 /DNA_END=4000 /DNA_ORIENTATION=+